jgi:hypothetical protein
MKKMITLGLVVLSRLVVVTLRRTGTSPLAVPEGKPTSAESQRIFRAAPIGQVASHLLLVTPPVQSVHAMLLAAVEAESDSDRKIEAPERAVECVSDADLPALLDSLALDTSPGAAEMSLPLIRRWAVSNPAVAAAWTSQLPKSPEGHAALKQVAIAWADTDLPAAAVWVHAMPEGGSKQAVMLALAYEAARTEPVMALELASTIPPARERDDLLVHAISQWAGTHSTNAVAWAMEVPDPDLRQRLVAAVAIASAEQDGTMAATLAANSLGAGEAQDRATVSIVQRWAQTSPSAAASWVSQFPDIPSRDAAVQNLLASWTAPDAEAAGCWVRELPVGSLRDVGIIAYAQALADHSFGMEY